MFPAAFLAWLEEHLELPVGSYVDLIAGTSTGGIIAIGLGLGLSAKDILHLYEDQGPAIFDQQHGIFRNWIRQRWRSARHWLVSEYDATDLLPALDSILGERKLGESKTCLLIPAWHPVLERVYIYKTAHHPRLESDYRQPAVDAAMATAAADVPTTALHCRSGRTCRRRGVGEQPRRRGGRQGGRRSQLAGRSTESSQHRHHHRRQGAAAVGRETAYGDPRPPFVHGRPIAQCAGDGKNHHWSRS